MQYLASAAELSSPERDREPRLHLSTSRLCKAGLDRFLLCQAIMLFLGLEVAAASSFAVSEQG